MKRSVLVLAAAGLALAGCGGPPKNMATQEELAALRTDHEGKIKGVSDDLDRKLKESVFELEKRMTSAFKELPEMLATYQKMKNTLEDLAKLKEELEKRVAATDLKVETANKNLITVLEAEEKLLSERVAEIRRTLEQLKK